MNELAQRFAVAPITRGRRARQLHAAVQRVPPMLGAPTRELLRMPTLAMLANDWPTAARAARSRLARCPADEGALVALAVALWELGREDEARAAVDGADANAPSSARLRAAARFFHHIDEPSKADEALDALPRPDALLLIGVGRAWRRHGDLTRAIGHAERVLATSPKSAAALQLRRGALAEQRVATGDWLPAAPRRPVERVPGRVLHLLHRSLPHHRSGSTYRSLYTVRAQRAAGLDPYVLTQPGFGPAGAEEIVDGVPHVRAPRRAGPGAPIDERLRDHLDAAEPVVRRLRPAVLQPASDYANALVALELGRRCGLPVVYEVRGFPEVLKGRWSGSRATFEKSAWRRRTEARCWLGADRVVTLADVMKRHIVAHGVDPGRVHVVPNAVDAEAFRPVAPDPVLRRRLGLPDGDPVLGYVSTLSPYEGVATLVEAVAVLAARGRRSHALIVGDGSERIGLAQLARRLGVGDRVHFTGSVPHADVAAHLALIDVFVVPRTAEVTCQLVTPLKPYEAMAAGRAVVVSRTEALSEMVLDGETGHTFTPEDAADLAAVAERLIEAPDLRAALGERARDWVRRERSWEANAARYRRLYEELGAA